MVVSYVCNDCNKCFNKKTYYTRHKNKKFPCAKDCKLNSNSDTVNNKENKLSHQNNLLDDINVTENKNDDSTNVLKILHEIIKDMNLLKQTNIELQNKIKSLEEKVVEVKPTNINLINNNNNITINIIGFGNEDLSFINETCIKKLIYTGYDSVKNYVKLVHFNDDKPEYQNIYISNKRQKNEVMVNDGNKWNIAQTDDIIDKIFSKSITFIQDKLDTLKNTLPETKIKGVNRLIKDYNEDDTKIIKKLSKEVVLEIYNNRDKPISNSILK
jgi:hypothetical protein